MWQHFREYGLFMRRSVLRDKYRNGVTVKWKNKPVPKLIKGKIYSFPKLNSMKNKHSLRFHERVQQTICLFNCPKKYSLKMFCGNKKKKKIFPSGNVSCSCYLDVSQTWQQNTCKKTTYPCFYAVKQPRGGHYSLRCYYSRSFVVSAADKPLLFCDAAVIFLFKSLM